MTVSYNISDTLLQKVDQLSRKNGASWSIQGHIAYILGTENKDHFSQNGGNLRISYLECIDGKHWQLAPPTCFNINAMLAESNAHYANKKFPSINHVLFSNTGWDLFTADEDGNVTILVTGIKKVDGNGIVKHSNVNEEINQNIVQVQYSRTSFNAGEIFYTDHNFKSILNNKNSKISSVKWLNLEKAVISNIPAIRIQQNAENQVLNGCASKMGAAADDSCGYYYRYNAQQHKAYGASHPLVTKQACIAICENGQIKFYHQKDHGIEYDPIFSQLENNIPEDDLITKSSIAFQKDGKIIIVAYYEKSNYLKFYEVEVHWNYLQKAAKLLAENPNYRMQNSEKENPTLTVRKVYQKNMNNVLEPYVFKDVNLVSPNFDLESKMDLILTVENKRYVSTDPTKTTVLRYQFENIPSKNHIHQVFKDIGSKNGNDVLLLSDTVYKLNYLQAVTFNDSILDIELLHLDMFVSIVLSSGIIKIFERKNFSEIVNQFTEKNTLEHISTDKNFHLPEKISSLLDAGFEFPKIEKQPVYFKISPNMCSYVTLPYLGTELEVYCISSNNVDINYYNGATKGLLLTKAAALALSHTTACYFGCFTDDLVATIRNELMILAKVISDNYSYRLMISIVQEGHRAINLNIDIPPEQSDKMTQNQPLQRLLTLQLSLGTSENWKRTRSGKIALALVNLRYVASSVLYTIHTIYSNMQRFVRKGLPATDTLLNAKMREECILSVLGIIRWCLDYVVLLSQELLELNSAFKSQNNAKVERLLKDSIVIPLILGKIPRSFLVFSIANIRRLFSFVQKFVEKTDPNLTAKITPDNPMGAFDVVEEMFIANDMSVIQKNFGNSGRVGAGANSKNGKAIVTTPTFEAYYRLGLMIKRLPVSLVAFEKFLSEADGPLRNMKLDAPMALAVEQQIVCQGYVSKNFMSAMKKLSEVFNRSVLNGTGTRMSDLYFYDVSWLGLETLKDDYEIEENGDYLSFEDIYNSKIDFSSCSSTTNQDQFSDESKKIKEEADTLNSDLMEVDIKGTENVDAHKDGEEIANNQSDAKRKIQGSILLATTDLNKTREAYGQLLYRNIEHGNIIDSLRKEWITPDEVFDTTKKNAMNKYELNYAAATSIHVNGNINRISHDAADLTNLPICTTTALTMDAENRPKLRKCIRCGAISIVHDEVMYIPNSMAFVTNPVFQHYQRICICGGSWANL